MCLVIPSEVRTSVSYLLQRRDLANPPFAPTYRRPPVFAKSTATTCRMANSTPVHFFSHGSTMMLGEESASATYWKKCGDEALANGVKHVVIMVLLPFPSKPWISCLTGFREPTGQLLETKLKWPQIQTP